MLNTHLWMAATLLVVGEFLVGNNFQREYDYIFSLNPAEEQAVITLAHQVGIERICKISTIHYADIFRTIWVKECEKTSGRTIAYRIVGVKYQRWIDKEAQGLPEENRESFRKQKENLPGDHAIHIGDFWTQSDYVYIDTLTLLHVNNSVVRIGRMEHVSIEDAEKIFLLFFQKRFELSTEYREWLEKEKFELKNSGEWDKVSENTRQWIEHPIETFLMCVDLSQPDSISFDKEKQKYSITFGNVGVWHIIDFRIKDNTILIMQIRTIVS